jgi:uncharacterized DUF497 family protein
MEAVAGFDWDAGNRETCGRHGVSVAEIESVFYGPVAVQPDPTHSSVEDRFKAIGRTEQGRAVFVVFALRRAADTPDQRAVYAPQGG